MPAGPPARAPTSRLDERAVLRTGLLLSGAFVAASLVAFAARPIAVGHWAGTHFALAGAMLVAVGTFMPHFGVTLAGSSPERPLIRLAGLAALASGAALAVVGVLGSGVVALVGAGLIWVGLAITAWTTFRPARRPLARRHPIVQGSYAVALSQVAIGVAIAALFVAGWEPAISAWTRLKPAHVWLNLFGFVSLTIAGTLVYLYPTILGARIRAHVSLVAMIGGPIVGPPLVAVGAVIGSAIVAVIGSALTVLGAVGQLAYAVDVWRRRGRWTTDPGWHRLASGHVAAAMIWYLAAAAVALLGVIREGPAPPGWGLGALALPLVGGWALQVLVGAWTHLVPAVASARPEQRAVQRQILGRASVVRLVTWNAGVLVAWIGLALDVLPVALAGVVCFAAAVLTAVILLVVALAPVGRDRRGP